MYLGIKNKCLAKKDRLIFRAGIKNKSAKN
jgi:hypothetical protein